MFSRGTEFCLKLTLLNFWIELTQKGYFRTKKEENYHRILHIQINDTHREKLCFYSIQYKNGCLAASDFFHIFTQSIKFYTFYYQV